VPSVNTLLARHAVDQSIDMLRYGASVKRGVLGLLSKMEQQMIGLLANSPLTAFNDRRYKALIAGVRDIVSSTYDAAAAFTDSALRGVMTYVVEDVARTVYSLTGIDLFGRVANADWIASVAKNSLVQGAPNAAWWEKQSQELVFKFEQQVRLGMVANETTDKIVARIRGDQEAAGVLFQTRANAAALVQTAIAESANDARLEMYRKNADIIKGVQQISTLDERTTDICIAYDLAVWDLDGEPIEGTDLPFDGGPPRHWNCRSTLVPVLKSSEELGTDVQILEGSRASMDGQVSEKMSFGDWLETKSPEQQDAILGKGKAQLWRDGKITLRDLVNQDGRPLTLEQLQARSVANTAATTTTSPTKAWVNTIPVDKEGMYHLYHGTTIDRAKQIIEGSALKTPEGSGPGWMMLTTSREQALKYAGAYGSDTAVIEYAIPRDMASKLLTAPREHDVYDIAAQAHGLLRGSIPSDWIVVDMKSPASWPISAATGGPVSAEFASSVRGVYGELPDAVRGTLINNGHSIMMGDRLSSIDPRLKGVTPRGWSKGMTWDNAQGLHSPTTNQSFIAEFRINPWSSEVEKTPRIRMEAVLRHEVGHGYDQSLGLERFKDGWGASNQKEFTTAYNADVRGIPTDQRDRFSYFLQTGKAGKEETFAEVFNVVVGGIDTEAIMRERLPMTIAFPRVTQLIKQWIGG
jgi:hypothetical protein